MSQDNVWQETSISKVSLVVGTTLTQKSQWFEPQFHDTLII